MLKYFFFFFLLLSFNQSYSQKVDYDFSINKIPVINGSVSYTLIDSLPNKNIDKIHARILEWLSMNFKSLKRVIDLDDKNDDKIIAKVLSNEVYGYKLGSTNHKFKYDQYFTLNFSIKNNKYRLVMSDFVAKGIVSPKTYMIKQELNIEDYLTFVPNNYNYEALSKQQKYSIHISKQILENSYNLSTSLFESVKDFMNKDDDF